MTTRGSSLFRCADRLVWSAGDAALRAHETREESIEEEALDPDAGDRFDPFCHTLDDAGHALCFADIRGRKAHQRRLPSTSSGMGAQTCQNCGKVICPTCLEIEYRLPETA